jgi:hypothetical protein
MADIRRERSVREPQETQFVGLTGAILRAVEICGAVLVRAWDAILRLGTKFPSAMWAGTDAILRFGFEFEVGFIALFALVIFIGSRYETVFLLFKSKPGEAIEWELVLCVTLLIVFIGLPLLPLETHIREQKLPAYLLYAMVLVLIFSFIIFDTSVGLVDLLDDGNFTKYDIEERKENLLVSVLNIVLIMSIAQIFYLRTRLQCVTAPVTAPSLQPSHSHSMGAPLDPTFSALPLDPTLSALPLDPTLSALPLVPTLSALPLDPTLSALPLVPTLSALPLVPTLSALPLVPTLSAPPPHPHFPRSPPPPHVAGSLLRWTLP